MKSNTKSSITLPPHELALVEELARRLKAKTKVEVIRRGLKLLKETTDRAQLRKAYAQAAEAVQKHGSTEIADLDPLAGEGTD